MTDDYLGMSDADFLNANPAEMEDADYVEEKEVLEAEVPVEESEDDAPEAELSDADEDEAEPESEASEEDPDDDQGEEEAPESDESEDTGEPEEEKEIPDDAKFQDFFNSVTKEFKANGKTMKVEDPNDVIRLMQMGANYNRKMAALKPNMKMLKMLEKADILNEEKLSYLIDLNQKDPKAITKLLADSNVDPMDLNLDEASEYRSSDHSVDEREIDLDSVIEEIRDSATFNQTINLVSKEWDDYSKQAVANQPQLLQVLNDHMASGIYDLISTELESERMLGRLSGQSDIEAYQQIGDALSAAGKFDHLFSEQPQAPASKPRNTEKKKADDSKRRNKRRAASPAKPTAPSAPKDDFNPLGMSDEEFLNQSDSKFL